MFSECRVANQSHSRDMMAQEKEDEEEVAQAVKAEGRDQTKPGME